MTGALSCAALLAGCDKHDEGSGGSAESAATNPMEGKLGGKLIVRTSCSEALINAVVPAFTEETGVSVRVIEAPVSELFSWYGSDAASGADVLEPAADVVWGGDPSWYVGFEGLLDEYISGENNAMREDCRSVDGCITPVTREVAVIAMGAESFEGDGFPEVTGYESLLDERLAEHVVMEDPVASECGLAHLAGIEAELGAAEAVAGAGADEQDDDADTGDSAGEQDDESADVQGDERDYAGRALDENAPWRYVSDLLAAGASVMTGDEVRLAMADDSCVALTSEQLVLCGLADGSLSLEPVYPRRGAFVTCGCTAIVLGCEHLAQAQAWIDFVTSQRCQQALVAEARTRSVRADVADSDGLPEVGEAVVPEREALLAMWPQVRDGTWEPASAAE